MPHPSEGLKLTIFTYIIGESVEELWKNALLKALYDKGFSEYCQIWLV